MKKNKESKIVLPNADIISAMESLKIYGGKGNPSNPQDTNVGCSNKNCSCKDPDPILNTVATCNVYCNSCQA